MKGGLGGGRIKKSGGDSMKKEDPWSHWSPNWYDYSCLCVHLWSYEVTRSSLFFCAGSIIVHLMTTNEPRILAHSFLAHRVHSCHSCARCRSCFYVSVVQRSGHCEVCVFVTCPVTCRTRNPNLSDRPMVSHRSSILHSAAQTALTPSPSLVLFLS